ncbi:probable receptor-like protein kinase At2g47060 isoform X3 [Helianthus annuus]|uniref:probable receptor-like protein kinase At2g47060 isoform X3 n=1 Tax=Helianthus annuus TaxID=4232 RepID=UPI000B900FB9|nr:probable receptor-like protein kinase At2g47060 isoform X3 [Helianthus annuus]
MYMFVCICLNEFHRFRCCLFRYAEVSIQDDYVRDENVHDAYVELNQLSDFGLAKWVTPTGLQITSTNVAGTFGYLVPEYFTHGKFMEKIDVYAFGVVLLELLTGRKPISNGHPKGEESLVMWANPVLNSGKFSRLLDPILGVDYDVDQMECMALAAMLCIRRVPRARPQITIAYKCYLEALYIQPTFGIFYSNLAGLFMESGDLSRAHQYYKAFGMAAEAIVCYQRTLQSKPDYAMAYGNLASVYDEQGNLDIATVNFNGETYESPNYCTTLRQAEHSAAGVALNALMSRVSSNALAGRILVRFCGF